MSINTSKLSSSDHKGVLPDREILARIAVQTLTGTEVDVRWHADNRRYRLIELVGRGQTGVAWRVRDVVGRDFALKFVLRAEYATHSLDAETQRANSLESHLFAKINFFGEPHFEPNDFDSEPFYAIAVDWIEGTSLRQFLATFSTTITPDVYLQFTRDLCELLQCLKNHRLCHSDLHDENVLVRAVPDALLGSSTLQLAVIDTGQMKTEERRLQLLEQWQQDLAAIESLNAEHTPQIRDAVQQIQQRIEYFARTDQEWVVFHLCSLYNRMQRDLASFDSIGKRFVRDLPESLRRMIDPDPSRRIDEPRRMHDELVRLWQQSSHTNLKGMVSPFDLPSAELIRSDRQLMALFSDEYPRLEACRSVGPIYLYGPRGCGKSTILRSLSISAVLDGVRPFEDFAKCPFLGIYMSASQELRSRFWLMKESDFDLLEGHIVKYFNLLLVESLVQALDAIFAWCRGGNRQIPFSLNEDIATRCAALIRARVGIDATTGRYAGISHFSVLRDDLRRARDRLWLQILDRQQSAQRPDAQVIFDICQRLEEAWPFLRDHRLVFLIDDYSNQRIPIGLQKRLNQAITFSKQGSPIFKVASEYDGVDLEGVQEGREVNEVNVGYEYVSLQNAGRHRFLQSMLERRFAYMDQPVDLLTVLPLSTIEPATAMARAIRDAVSNRRKFLYHGLDTISDLCSGDFAMGIDLIRGIFDRARVDWRAPREIGPALQDTVIRDYAKHEFEHIRYQTRDGRIKFSIADRLCWLSKECILTKDTTKDAQTVPVVKNHLDISEAALRQLQEQYPEQAAVLKDLVSRGVLFPLQGSRARQARDSTYRLMVRRILLAVYTTALGRHQPIKIDDVQRLLYLLTEPDAFAQDELQRTSIGAAANQNQRKLQFDDAESTDG